MTSPRYNGGMTKKPEEMTMEEHADAWAKDTMDKPPERGTAQWDAMYEKWIEYAFGEFASLHDMQTRT